MKARPKSSAQPYLDPLIQQISTKNLKTMVEQLIGPRNRLYSPKRLAKVERDIFKILEDLNLEVQYCPFSVEFANKNVSLNSSEIAQEETPIFPTLKGQNIVATKRGSGQGVIVIGAHMDTVQESPGADDNTSAVVALLEVARLLAPMKLQPSIVFVIFDMEEIGLHGARAFVQEQLGEIRPDASIIFESIGYTSHLPGSQIIPPGFSILYPWQARKVKARQNIGDWFAVLYRQPAGRLARSFMREMNQVRQDKSTVVMRDPCDMPIIGRLIHRFLPFARDFARSDHLPFWEQNLPAIMITDTADFRNPNYHRHSDLPDTLDYNYMRQAIVATVRTVEKLGNSAG